MASQDKKKKGKHISEGDKALFLEVMKRYVSVIESKKHDNDIIKKKRSAWDDIHTDFNAEATVNKTLDQLKVLWKDCKAKAKKAMSRDKRERIKTGGGNKDYEIDGTTKVIVEMIPQFFESVSSVQDDDKEVEDICSDEEGSEKEDEPAQGSKNTEDSIIGMTEEMLTSKTTSSTSSNKCK